MKNFALVTLVILIFGGVFFAAYTIIAKRQNTEKTSTSQISPVPTETLLGGDRDEYGCITSAGYSWCEAKKKCLRSWEETCEEASDDVSNGGTEELKVAIKEAIIAKRGQDAEKLDIGVSKIEGLYAQGSASEEGLGGGMWFAAKVGGEWDLVWDGNGIITCDDLADYPNFPTSIIPECYDETSREMVER